MASLEKFLPIGTVVMLKDATKSVMINAYGVFSTDKVYSKGKEVPRKKELFQYGGCLYPEGIVDPNFVCAFNHSDIKNILHMGLVTDEYRSYTSKLEKNYDEYKKKFESQS